MLSNNKKNIYIKYKISAKYAALFRSAPHFPTKIGRKRLKPKKFDHLSKQRKTKTAVLAQETQENFQLITQENLTLCQGYVNLIINLVLYLSIIKLSVRVYNIKI